MPFLRPALIASTFLLAAIAAAWVWLWLRLTAGVGNEVVLHQLGPLVFLACGPLAALVAALVCVWRARAAAWLLTAGGIGASLALYLAHVPDYGAPEGLWCLGVAMVALGAGWFALAAGVRRGAQRTT